MYILQPFSTTPHFIVSVARSPEVPKVRSLTELSGLRVSVESYVAPKDPLQLKRCQRFRHAAKLRLHTPMRRVWGLPPLRWLSLPRGNSPNAVAAGKPRGELPALCEVERSEGRTSKAGARPWPKERRHSPSYRSERTAGRALCRADGPERGVESRRSRGRCQGHYPTNPYSKSPFPAGHGSFREA